MSDKAMTEQVRRGAQNPGTEWRVLARDAEREIELSNDGLFDELVVDHWLHLEKMDDRTWWMRLGDARLSVFVAEDGSVRVDVQRGCYDEVLGKTETVEPEEK